MSFPVRAPVRPPDLSWRFPTSVTRILPNGLRIVVLQQSRLPMIRVRLMIPGGRRKEVSQIKPGVTGLAMRCARYGTADYTASELALSLDSLGTQLSCGASLDALSFSMQCLSEHFEESLKLFTQVLREPLYTPEEVEREKAKLVAAKRQAASSPTGTSSLWMGKLLFGAHPYGAPTASPEEVIAIEPDDLVRFHREAVRPRDAVLVIAGDLSVQGIEERLEPFLGDWKGSVPLCSTPPQPLGALNQDTLLLDRPGSAQTHVLLGTLALRRSHPDHLALSCINHIFGGGASGRLFKDLREERSLTYGCSSSLDSGAWAGDLVASMSCSTSKTEEALDALLSQMHRICTEPVSEVELEQCVRYKVGAWPKSGSSLGGLSSLLLLQQFHGLPAEVWTDYPDAVRNMTVDHLMDCAQKHLSYGRRALVLVGDGDALEPMLRQRGGVIRIPVDERPGRKGSWPD